MGLQLYRRHSKACIAKRQEDSTTGKFEEGRRRWKKCSCQIFASGTLGGKFKRQCTEKWEWDKAEAVADGWENAGSWPSGPKPPVSVPVPRQNSIGLYFHSFPTSTSRAIQVALNLSLIHI